MRLKAILSKAGVRKRLSAPFCFGQDGEFSGITGKFQVEDRVVHLVAQKLWEPKLELKPTAARNRDFH